MTPAVGMPGDRASPAAALWRALAVLVLLLVFLAGVRCLGDGFKLLGKELLDAFFLATANPFIGLMVGILGTTLVQSSSVSTSMIVGLVAAPENPLPVANAVPMIMGANIGTTVTNTIVSLGHMARPNEFRQAFAVATCHDFFNFMAVVTLLPLELATGYLQKSARFLASLLGDLGGVQYQSPLKDLLKAMLVPVKALAHALFESSRAQGILLILVAGVLIFTALLLLVRVMRSAVQSKIEALVNRFLGRRVLVSMIVGAVVTVAVQSSSVTTSLLVPLAGAGVLTLQQAFPITLGANIGTTVTALLASLAASGANAQAGVVIALVHLLFNLSGTLLVYPWKPVRRIPLALARGLGSIAVRSRRWALVYVIMLFYFVPAAFALLNRIGG